MKDVKRLAKSPLRNNTPSDPNVKCSSCKQTDHKSSRSPLCANHVSNKIVFFFTANLGGNYKTFTKRLPLDRHVRTCIKQRTIAASADVRNITIRIQIVVNYYILVHLNHKKKAHLASLNKIPGIRWISL